MKGMKYIVLLIVIIGALNWGLWGFFQFDAIAYLFRGASSPISRVIYAIIGLCGLYALSFFGCCGKCKCKCCEKNGQGCGCKK